MRLHPTILLASTLAAATISPLEVPILTGLRKTSRNIRKTHPRDLSRNLQLKLPLLAAMKPESFTHRVASSDPTARTFFTTRYRLPLFRKQL